MGEMFSSIMTELYRYFQSQLDHAGQITGGHLYGCFVLEKLICKICHGSKSSITSYLLLPRQIPRVPQRR